MGIACCGPLFGYCRLDVVNVRNRLGFVAFDISKIYNKEVPTAATGVREALGSYGAGGRIDPRIEPRNLKYKA
jgi:hypothetical protein